MGLQLLEREKAVYYGQVEDIRKKMAQAKAAGETQKLAALNQELAGMRNFQPDFSGKEYLLQRQLQPEARGDIIAQLREAGIRPTAMMDVSAHFPFLYMQNSSLSVKIRFLYFQWLPQLALY